MKAKIIKIEEYQNCTKTTVEMEVGKETITERFSISPNMIKNGEWKNIVKKYIENYENKKNNKLSVGEIKL